MECKTAPGVGKAMYFSVSVGGQTSVVFGPVATASYTVPAVSSVTVPGGGLLATTGGELVTITGTARRSSAEHLIATKALRLHSYGLDAHCR